MTQYRAFNRAGQRLKPGGRKVFNARTLAWLRRRRAGVSRVERVDPGGEKLLAIAKKEIGTTERPRGSNRGARVQEYQAATDLGGTGWPWCLGFCQWCINKAGLRGRVGYRGASVYFLEVWARKAGRWRRRPAVGRMVVLFGRGVHVGFVEKYSSRYLTTIEGNTSGSDAGSQNNGGGVYRKTRRRSDAYGYVAL